jgi:hypothetical protein
MQPRASTCIVDISDCAGQSHRLAMQETPSAEGRGVGRVASCVMAPWHLRRLEERMLWCADRRGDEIVAHLGTPVGIGIAIIMDGLIVD